MALKPVALSIAAIGRPVLDRRGRAFASLVANWPRLVGADLAARALPEKLGRDQAGGAALTLRVGGGAAVEIQHDAPQIIERINAALGHQAVARLRLIQAPLPARPAPSTRRRKTASPDVIAATVQASAKLAPGRLRDALAGLGAAMVLEDSPSESVGCTISSGETHA